VVQEGDLEVLSGSDELPLVGVVANLASALDQHPRGQEKDGERDEE